MMPGMMPGIMPGIIMVALGTSVRPICRRLTSVAPLMLSCAHLGYPKVATMFSINLLSMLPTLHMAMRGRGLPRISPLVLLAT